MNTKSMKCELQEIVSLPTFPCTLVVLLYNPAQSCEVAHSNA